jgi:hypothetical protein
MAGVAAVDVEMVEVFAGEVGFLGQPLFKLGCDDCRILCEFPVSVRKAGRSAFFLS